MPMNRPLPALFVSHGSPMMALEPGDTGAFLCQLGQTLDREWGRPKAVLAVSAHTTARSPVLLGGAKHEAIYDFGGFPQPLYELRYDAPGAPALAQQLSERLNAPMLDRGGLDHGIWTALRYLYPDADVPVLPLALTPMASPVELMALGEQLAGLANDGVLVLATGSITHNLRLLMTQRPWGGTPREHDAEMPESAAFRDWFAARSGERDWDALSHYRVQAPHAVLMHPTDEHLLPWFVAAGVGGRDTAPRRIFEAVTFGCLGMDAYAFGPQAAALQAAVKQGLPQSA
jgi:4,5-DOPA dioxygenase extradiol